MWILTTTTLRAYWTRRRDAEGPLRAWVQVVRAAQWSSPADLKRQFGSASVLKGGRAVFNIGGNRHRLVCAIDYARRGVFIKFIGTHEEYDAVDAHEVEHEE